MTEQMTPRRRMIDDMHETAWASANGAKRASPGFKRSVGFC
jgi:hypothetical protein